MKALFAAVFSLALLATGNSQTLDELVEKFMSGNGEGELRYEGNPLETAIDRIPKDAPNLIALTYIAQVKASLIDVERFGTRPVISSWLTDSKNRPQTYHGVKAIYEKEKTPLLAYIMVCPALFMEDEEILPELIACIGKDPVLKKRFDSVYKSFWRKRLVPDF